MGEDCIAGLLEGSHTKSGVPIEHLDYRYVEGCKNAKELEKILKVLRSGEEGHYPDLVEFTEKKLEEINPKSKSLRKELPIKTYYDLTKTEKEEITDDLQDWVEKIDQADKTLKDVGETGKLNNDSLPPVRSTISNQDISSQPQQKASVTKTRGTVLPRGYHEWDRFDPDKEIEALDQKEEEELRKKQEKARANNKDTVPSKLNLEDKSETEKNILANREKEKGNEAFQSGHYSEAVGYYCRSIELNPKAAAVYNNRAIAEIRLEEFQKAIDDCNTVLSMEPNNVKAFLRRSIAHKGQGQNEEAKEDLVRVLAIEPNNKRAQELLSDMDKQKRTEQVQNKPVIPEDKANNQMLQNERTYTNIQENDLPTSKNSTARRGKRLKIVEVESESEGAQILSDENCAVETSEPAGDVAQQPDSDNRTMNGSNLQTSVKHTKVNQQLHLPGLADRAKDEGTRLFKLGRYAEAAEKFTQAIDVLWQDRLMYLTPLCSLLCNRGSCLVRIGDCAGCVADCTAALELVPGSVRPLLKRADAHETTEKFKKAWQDYQSALKIQPHNVTALQGNSMVSRQLGNLYGSNWKEKVAPVSPQTSSASFAPEGSSTLPLPPQAVNMAAQQLLTPPPDSNGIDTSQIEGATGITNTAQPTPSEGAVGGATASAPYPTPVTKTSSSEDKVDPSVMFSQYKDHGNSLVKQSRFKDAVLCYTECINIDPNNVAVYTNRALCHLRLNQHALAIEDTTEALRLQPSNVKALFRRALAKKGMAQYDSAARDLFELQKIEPKNVAAKKELEVVLELCREERRASLEKATEAAKKKTNVKETKQVEQQENQSAEELQWKRIQIEDVEHDEEDDEPTDKGRPSSAKPPTEASSNHIEQDSVVKSVKLTKSTAYDFFQTWNSVKKSNTKGYADLLRQLGSKSLAHVLSNKLDAQMFNSIVTAFSEEMVPQGEESAAYDALEQLCHAQRFDMVLLFLSAKEKNELRHLFSKLEAARSLQNFATEAEFGSLKKKYKL